MTENKENKAFESLLEFLRQERGFDFTGYKRSSLMRRVKKRMQTCQLDNFEQYHDYLQVHSEEFLPLFNTILINVTGFFRDRSAWIYLQQQVITRILEQKSAGSQIRVWSAGCSSGQEAYTLAMILAEAIGVESFRRCIKIYATDVDEEALTQARHASYSDRELNSVPDELRQKYFEESGGQYVFRPDLRRGIIFGRHDLVQDAPISRLDLLVCRNTLMYFNAETQGKILNRFHFALNDTGTIFFGKAEMMLTHANLFAPINLQHRIFRPVPNHNARRHIISTAIQNDTNSLTEKKSTLLDLAFDTVTEAQLIVDRDGNLTSANMAARSMFGINLLDYSRPLQDLEISYRPLELRSYIDRLYSDRRFLIARDVARYLPEGTTQYFDVHFNPLAAENGNILGVSVAFINVTECHELRRELQRSSQELETANEELQSSNEELETTNEELQSTNEELETTNEELQSTNEELETMNEELHSTNEELQTINDELRLSSTELDRINAFLNSILSSIKAGVVVIDNQFNILSWNEEANNMWGMRFDEVEGRSLFGLDIGLPVEQLREPILNCINNVNDAKGDRQEISIESINRRGKTIECRLSINPLIGRERKRQGAIIMMEIVK